MSVTIDTTPTWRDIARVADGASLRLSAAAWAWIDLVSRTVERIVSSGIGAYGVNTGVGALLD